jgi:hypothetical protein
MDGSSAQAVRDLRIGFWRDVSGEAQTLPPRTAFLPDLNKECCALQPAPLCNFDLVFEAGSFSERRQMKTFRLFLAQYLPSEGPAQSFWGCSVR